MLCYVCWLNQVVRKTTTAIGCGHLPIFGIHKTNVQSYPFRRCGLSNEVIDSQFDIIFWSTLVNVFSIVVSYVLKWYLTCLTMSVLKVYVHLATQIKVCSLCFRLLFYIYIISYYGCIFLPFFSSLLLLSYTFLLLAKLYVVIFNDSACLRGKRVLEPQLPAPRSFGHVAERNVRPRVATMTSQLSQQTSTCSVKARSNPVLSGQKRQPQQLLLGSSSHTQSTKQNIHPRVAR